MNNDTSFDIIQESNPVQTVAPTNKEDNDMLRATEKITALYCRLSVEDTKDEKKYCRYQELVQRIFLPKIPVAKSVRSTRQRENEASD